MKWTLGIEMTLLDRTLAVVRFGADIARVGSLVTAHSSKVDMAEVVVFWVDLGTQCKGSRWLCSKGGGLGKG